MGEWRETDWENEGRVVWRVKRDWLGEWLGEWEKSKSVRYWKRIWVIEETKGKMKTNECVNTMSIGSLVVGLLAIDDENWFRVFEESSQAFMHIQIVLNILCQFFAHTLATVTFNKHVNYMSIGLIISDWRWKLISRLRRIKPGVYAYSNRT